MLVQVGEPPIQKFPSHFQSTGDLSGDIPGQEVRQSSSTQTRPSVSLALQSRERGRQRTDL